MVSTGVQPPPHLLGQTLHAIDRLRDHIDRIDAGKFYAVDDLAVVLRLLVHPGNGNDLLGRVQRAYGARSISLMVSRPPEILGALMSFGLLPARDKTHTLGARQMLMNDWINSPFLVVEVGSRQRTWTWAAFMNMYANKWGGAHLDDAIPIELQVVDKFAFGGFSLSTYLLRTGAVAVWNAAQVLWTDSTFRRSGERLSDEELSRMRVTSAGESDDPDDRLRFGEPQFFAYRGGSAELLLLMSRHNPCSARLAIGGGLSYDMTVQPENASQLVPDISEPRTPGQPPLSAADFKLGRQVELQVRCLTAD